MIQAIINGVTHNFDDYFKVTDFVIASPSFEYFSEKIEYRLGKIVGGRTLNEREITITGTITDQYDIAYRNIMKTFSINEYELYDTTQSDHIWLVSPTSIEIQRLTSKSGTVTIKCKSYMGYAYSKNKIKQTFTKAKFNVTNYGDIAIDPRMHNLTINIKGIASNITLKNLTTGESIVINTSLTTNDTISIDKYQYKKNGALITSNTNRKLITLAPGTNQIEIIGVSNPNISFNFNQYYY